VRGVVLFDIRYILSLAVHSTQHVMGHTLIATSMLVCRFVCTKPTMQEHKEGLGRIISQNDDIFEEAMRCVGSCLNSIKSSSFGIWSKNSSISDDPCNLEKITLLP
jgi:hypothetical protein